MSSQVVVVTGASAGVGRAVARAFADRGDRVALLARGEEGLQQAVEGINGTGGTAIGVPVDVADSEAVEAAADRVERELGPIDVWVNNALSTVFAPFAEISPAEFRRVTETTYLGYVYGTRAALIRMLQRDRGVIVQVGSALAYRAIPLQAPYCAAKHAIKAIHESLRCELLHEGSGVTTTMVQLPAVNTPQFDWSRSRMRRRAQPVPPIYQPEVAARTIVHAADHPERREFWVGFSTVATILAERIAPGLLDHYLARTGYDSQQTDEPATGDRPSNLWEPVDDEPDKRFGAHGRFDEQAKTRSLQAWLGRHRPTFAQIGRLGPLGRLGRRRQEA
jgi:NAD(P)-dependent dehydrogenase (short-subunit alcohol dehydrogenase family)